MSGCVSSKEVLVIGAGIIGLSTAARLSLDGFDVTVLDELAPMDGCSSGNAGCLSEANLFPPASVDTLLRLPGLLLPLKGPLVVRPSYLATMVPWLLRASAALAPERFEAIVRVMAQLTSKAIDSIEDLADACNAGKYITRKGLLVACRTEKALAARAKRIPLWRRSGVAVERVTAGQMKEMVPALRGDLRGGLFFARSGRCSDPRGLGIGYANWLSARAVRLLRGRVQAISPSSDGLARVYTDSGMLTAATVVVCAGHGSKPMLEALGQTVPLACERGYHLMLPAGLRDFDMPTIFGEPYFAATPMTQGLRLAGTAEFASAEAPPNFRRAWVLLQQAREYLAGIDARDAVPWMGTRPSLPDGVPAIGRLAEAPQVVYAFGHGHNGLTLSAITAECVSALMTGETAPADLVPLSLDRFTRRRAGRPIDAVSPA